MYERFIKLRITCTNEKYKKFLISWFKAMDYATVNFNMSLVMVTFIEASNKEFILNSLNTDLNIKDIQIINL